MLRQLFELKAQCQQPRIRERSAQQFDPQRQPLGSEAHRQRQGWQSRIGAETAVVAGLLLADDHRQRANRRVCEQLQILRLHCGVNGGAQLLPGKQGGSVKRRILRSGGAAGEHTVHSRVVQVRAAATVIAQDIWRGPTKLTSGVVTAAWLGANGRPQRQPRDWDARFKALLAQTAANG